VNTRHWLFEFPNLAGTFVPVEIALEVSPEAVRRGSNIEFYVQRTYCGECGRDTLDEDAERFYETGVLEPPP
jgi:hypothetical protein